jgi:hypothetical protein
MFLQEVKSNFLGHERQLSLKVATGKASSSKGEGFNIKTCNLKLLYFA